jgi:Ca2+-transporting ATPase
MAFVVLALQLIVLYVPFMSSFFGVVPLSGLDLLIAIGAGALVLVAMEAEKFLRRK